MQNSYTDVVSFQVRPGPSTGSADVGPTWIYWFGESTGWSYVALNAPDFMA